MLLFGETAFRRPMTEEKRLIILTKVNTSNNQHRNSHQAPPVDLNSNWNKDAKTKRRILHQSEASKYTDRSKTSNLRIRSDNKRARPVSSTTHAIGYTSHRNRLVKDTEVKKSNSVRRIFKTSQ